MKFNTEKFERLQRQKIAGHEAYIRLTNEWRDALDQASRTEAMFIEGYDPRHSALAVIASDRKQSAAHLASRLAAIESGSLDLKEAFGLGGDAKIALARVYAQHLAAKKLYEQREQQGENNRSFGASFERLTEFARRHVRVNDGGAYPVEDRGTMGRDSYTGEHYA